MSKFDPYDHLDLVRNRDGSITRQVVLPKIPATGDADQHAPSDPSVVSKDVVLDAGKKTWLRVFCPTKLPSNDNSPVRLPIVIYFHGGGWILFSAANAMYHEHCNLLSSEIPCIVVSVEYRLAPESRLPAQYDDAMDAILWVKKQALDPKGEKWVKDYGDFSRCYLYGASNGANIVFNAALRALERDLEPLRFAGLIMNQPMFGGKDRTKSELQLATDEFLPLPVLDMMWELALPAGTDRDHRFCNPMADGPYREKIKSLGRCLVIGFDGDPMIDRQQNFVKMLVFQGVFVQARFDVVGFHGVDLGGGDAPPPPPSPANGGDFLLQLLRKPPQAPAQQPPIPSAATGGSPPTPLPPLRQTLSHDPAVAAVGLSLPFPRFSSTSPDLPYPPPWPNSPPFAPHNFFLRPPNPNPNWFPSQLPGFNHTHHLQYNHQFLGDDIQKLGFFGTSPRPSSVYQQELSLIFGSLPCVIQINEGVPNDNSYDNSASGTIAEGLMSKEREIGYRVSDGIAMAKLVKMQNPDTGGRARLRREGDWGCFELDDSGEQVMGSLVLEDELRDKNDKGQQNSSRDKDCRSDTRGQYILGHRMRNFKRQFECRSDIERLNAPFLSIYESLIPTEEEKAKQKQLLTLLEKLVTKEWPEAQLYLYGSCANSFGVSKSDIDVCFAIENADLNKSDVLLKLADILQSDNLQNVQALTRARVPIVKLMDPVTGISCDICINNLLAVENTKLLRDYAQIDVRLQQLAFIVKHWAKSRGVNETYQGTLSSYAYVLMCIHFLQHCKPVILPCLQGMERTYAVTVDNVECAYFDQVEKLRDFGCRNRESIAQLVWAFFNYWAYCHDYTNDVISVRTGRIISKRSKDWTRRIRNDRHLICIEDPFETSHDLGRVVDKYSIKVLREEFKRAAEIMQYDSDPCVTLFEPYIPS
ncbi:hypothetical protein F0562_014808 [Nyssa sinensis]|uniref:RNA uridylyltransferase n=1 Tax=Nyssa sinensis TaxID=561372 RepID=A0A5J4ZT40_9ASTE|nr:hypothetical protein F0562_014808 [Nyssa sinensis]